MTTSPSTLKVARDGGRELAILAFYFLGAVYFTYPLVTGLDRLVSDLADPLLNSWALSWVVHALGNDPRGLFDANIFHPETGTLAFSEHLLGIAALVAPVELLFRNPVLTHNVALFLLVTLSGYFLHRLVAFVTGSRVAGIVAGAFFAFVPYRLGHLSHLQLQATAAMPLVFLGVSRFCESSRRRWLAVLAAALFWVSASCGYYGVFTWLALGVVLPIELLRTASTGIRKRLGALAAVLALTALVLVPLARPYLRLEREFGFSRPLERVVPASARLHSYARSGVSWHQSLGLRGANSEQTLFPGVALAALSLLGFLLDGRRVLLYAALGLFAFWASLGPSAGLYAALHALVPGVSGLRVPARFSILVFLALSVAAGAAVGRIESWARLRGGRPLLLLLALLPLIELHGTTSRFIEAPLDVPGSERYLAAASTPEGAVVHLPMPIERERRQENAIYMLWSTAHFRRMANGYSAFAPPSFYELGAALESFPDARGLSLLEDRGISFVVFHKNRYLRGRSSELREELDAEPGLESVYDDAEVRVYRVHHLRER